MYTLYSDYCNQTDIQTHIYYVMITVTDCAILHIPIIYSSLKILFLYNICTYL